MSHGMRFVYFVTKIQIHTQTIKSKFKVPIKETNLPFFFFPFSFYSKPSIIMASESTPSTTGIIQQATDAVSNVAAKLADGLNVAGGAGGEEVPESEFRGGCPSMFELCLVL